VLFGLSAGVAFGFLGGFDGLIVGVVDGTGLGLAMGCITGLIRASDEPPTPLATLRSDRDASMLSLGTVGLGLGAVTALAVCLVLRFDGPNAGMVATLGTGIVAGLGIALPSGLGFTEPRPWPDYQICRVWLALRRRVPWKLMGFLEDAHRLGILRQAGPVYQFRHAQLQSRLAEVEANRGGRSPDCRRDL